MNINHTPLKNEMKTRLLFLLAIGVMGFSGTVFADCAPTTLQHHYDSSNAVFHGTLISAQYDTDKSSPTSWTFAIQESFKGTDSKKVIVKNADKYGEQFKQGLDYLVFAEGNQQQLELHLCNFQYYAFPTIVGGISVEEDVTPYCDPIVGCNASKLVRISCVFEYEN